MTDQPQNPKRRALFDLLRDPERLGRELGRYTRIAREAFDPPTFTPEEFRALQATVEQLEGQIADLQTQHDEGAQRRHDRCQAGPNFGCAGKVDLAA